MMTRTKKIISGILWMARCTATMMGLAVMLALTVGLASTALAGTGIGARFDLGKVNMVNATSTLVGNVNKGSVLAVKNNSGDPESEPLSLETTKTGLFNNTPPLEVDSVAKVDRLNVDLLDTKDSTDFASGTNGKANDANLLDGKDSTTYFSGKTYFKDGNNATPNSSKVVAGAAVTCDPGDAALGGGYNVFGLGIGNDFAVFAESTSGSTYSVSAKGLEPGFNLLRPNVTCADFPPLR